MPSSFLQRFEGKINTVQRDGSFRQNEATHVRVPRPQGGSGGGGPRASADLQHSGYAHVHHQGERHAGAPVSRSPRRAAASDNSPPGSRSPRVMAAAERSGTRSPRNPRKAIPRGGRPNLSDLKRATPTEIAFRSAPPPRSPQDAMLRQPADLPWDAGEDESDMDRDWGAPDYGDDRGPDQSAALYHEEEDPYYVHHHGDAYGPEGGRYADGPHATAGVGSYASQSQSVNAPSSEGSYARTHAQAYAKPPPAKGGYSRHAASHIAGNGTSGSRSRKPNGSRRKPQNGGRKKKDTRTSRNEALAEKSENALYYSKKSRAVSYRPKTLSQYKQSFPKEYQAMGKLQPDLNADELVEKRAKAARVKEFSRNLRQFNKKLPRRQTRPPPQRAPSKREKALAFARNNVPKPKARPKPRPRRNDLAQVEQAAQLDEVEKLQLQRESLAKDISAIRAQFGKS